MEKRGKIRMSDKYEITFNELCAVKREQLGLNISEVANRTGYTNYLHFERGRSKASPKNMAKIIDFYRITDDEIKKCRPYKSIGQNGKAGKAYFVSNTEHTIESLLKSVDKIHRKVETIEIKGGLGKMMLESAREMLKDVESKLFEIAIIDELIK